MKILIRLPNWLGDVVMSTAVINALKKNYPKCTIDIIIKKELIDVLKFVDTNITIYEFSKKEYPGLNGCYKFGKMIKKKCSYDIFISLPNSFSSACIGFFSGAKIRIGYRNDFRTFFLTHHYKIKFGLHRVDEYINLLENYFHIKISEKSVSLNKLEENSHSIEGEYLIFNINSEAQSRRMPLELATKLLLNITDTYNGKIILTGSKKDVEYVQKLENVIEHNNKLLNYAGHTTLNDLLLLINNASLILTVDSGIAHVANAFNKKTIVLFGAGDDLNTKPFNSDNLKVIRKIELVCAPCLSNTCKYGIPKCLEELNTTEIIKNLIAF